MPGENFKRKLVAILSADAVGYSRLMRDDEDATVRDLAAHRLLMKEKINQHDGRVVDSPGDNMLAEFASVVDAVNGGIAIQEAIKLKNADCPQNRRKEFRIGINLGDVISEDGRIYGDGVNIAARLESLASAGGIAISATVYEHVKNKLSSGFRYAGEQNIKNIPDPIQVYHLLLNGGANGKVVEDNEARSGRRIRMAGIFAVLVLCAAAALIWIYPVTTVLDEEAADTAKRPLPLSERASIAVLPFSNLSGDPEQAYFTDGITNDLISSLSRFGELRVIASNTIFTYKGKPVNIKAVGKELGVRYVLEGSVQKAGTKVRVNAQLIDATTEFHIWSEIYNRELKDIFAVQDEIVETIVGKLAIKIDTAERKRVMNKPTESMEAYDYLLRGMEHYRPRTCSENRKARRMFEGAIDIDPDFASAYTSLGKTYAVQAAYGCTEFPAQALQKVKDLALKALSLNASDADAYALLGFVYTHLEQYDLAIQQLNRAIELNPNDASSLRTRGRVMLWSGKVDDAIDSLETAIRFDTNVSPGFFMILGTGYYLKEQYDRAINVLEEGLGQRRDWVGNHIVLAAAYAQSGRLDDAEREAQEVTRLAPFFKVDNYGSIFRNQADRAKIIEGLRNAGLD